MRPLATALTMRKGNWLRDYSQAMDVAGLSKLSRQAILNLVMALSFLASGYATSEASSPYDTAPRDA
jgi:hypothetical protein